MFLLGGFPCPKVFAGFVGSARAPAEPDFGYRKARAKIQQKKIKCSPGVSEFCFWCFILCWLGAPKTIHRYCCKTCFCYILFFDVCVFVPCCVGLPHPKYLYWNVQIHLSTKRFTLAQTDSLQTHIYPE